MKIKVEQDEHLIAAGECFMFLCVIESYMRDFIVLREGGDDMRRRYNEAFGREVLPSDFAQQRLNLGTQSFGVIKDRFLALWPEWKKQRDVNEAIERVVLWRNGFGHANVQPFRPYLLYTPTDKSWKLIRRYMKCPHCLNYFEACQCSQDNLMEPKSVVLRCRDAKFLEVFYADIKTVDIDCLVPTAMRLDVAYRGLAWWEGDRYVVGQNPLNNEDQGSATTTSG